MKRRGADHIQLLTIAVWLSPGQSRPLAGAVHVCINIYVCVSVRMCVYLCLRAVVSQEGAKGPFNKNSIAPSFVSLSDFYLPS
jgi:hypothetical protein